jgi:renal tumor antigen
MHRYRLQGRCGEGTFSEVMRAAAPDGRAVAIKVLKARFSSLDAASSLREITALRRLPPHPHLIALLEVLYDAPTGRLALVFEMAEGGNVLEAMTAAARRRGAGGGGLPEVTVQRWIYEALLALEHMHSHGERVGMRAPSCVQPRMRTRGRRALARALSPARSRALPHCPPHLLARSRALSLPASRAPAQPASTAISNQRICCFAAALAPVAAVAAAAAAVVRR